MSTQQSWWTECKREFYTGFRKGWEGKPTEAKASAEAGAGSPDGRPFRLLRAMIRWYVALVVFGLAGITAAFTAADSAHPAAFRLMACTLPLIPLIGSLFIILRRRYWKCFFWSWVTSIVGCVVLGPVGIIPAFLTSMPVLPWASGVLALIIWLLPAPEPGTSSTYSSSDDSPMYESSSDTQEGGFWRIGGLARYALNERAERQEREQRSDMLRQFSEQQDMELVTQLGGALLQASLGMLSHASQSSSPGYRPGPVSDTYVDRISGSHSQAPSIGAYGDASQDGYRTGDSFSPASRSVSQGPRYGSIPQGSMDASGLLPSFSNPEAYIIRESGGSWATTATKDAVGNVTIRSPQSTYPAFAAPQSGGGYTVWGEGSPYPSSVSRDSVGNVTLRTPNSPYPTVATPNAGGGYTIWGGTGGRPASLSEDSSGNAVLRAPSK